VQAPRERSAQLRAALEAELERGRRELALPRTGYGAPIIVAVGWAGGELRAVAPAEAALRADPARAPDRTWLLVAALVGALVEIAEPGRPARGADLVLTAGTLQGHLALALPAREAHPELVALALEDALAGTPRLRAGAHAVPGHLLEGVEDLRAPIGAGHPLRIAEAVARLGGRPADPRSVDDLEEEVLALLPRPDALARAHDDPDPVRGLARRILQRLDGMGKWGGYHTEFVHLSRGVVGNERALALEVGRRLVDAELLSRKKSVGQDHVFLNPRRSGDIRRLIDAGTMPAGLVLPPG